MATGIVGDGGGHVLAVDGHEVATQLMGERGVSPSSRFSSSLRGPRRTETAVRASSRRTAWAAARRITAS